MSPQPAPREAMNYSKVNSLVGTIHLLARASGLAALYFDAQIEAMERRFPSALRAGFGRNPWLLRAEGFLSCYFDGDLEYSPEIPLDLRGTPFQESVWKQLQTIPPGATRGYGELARQIGRPGAARAVGAAVGKNPVSIIIPCHRAIGSSGTLTGYAGGLEIKRFLLEHEDKHRRDVAAGGARDFKIPAMRRGVARARRQVATLVSYANLHLPARRRGGGSARAAGLGTPPDRQGKDKTSKDPRSRP